MASSTPESKSLRILCYGDSLTEGYSCFGMSMTPYSKTLKSILEAVFLAGADKRKVEIVTDGVSGDRVTNASFNDRMVAQYSTASNSAPLYNYTLFLGGTNDLGWGLSASDIWSSIKTITATPLAHNSKLVLFTIPECGVKHRDLDKRRDELNALIRADAEKDGGRKGVHIFDLHKEIPYHGLNESEREQIWDDGLHFTPRGYERMGRSVAKRLFEIIREVEGGEKDDV